MSSIKPSPITPSSNIRLALSVTSGAEANGTATNIITVNVIYYQGERPNPAWVALSVTGNALFSNGSNTNMVSTDTSGRISVPITNRTIETVTVTAAYANLTSYADTIFQAHVPEPQYNLTGQVLVNNQVANGSNANRVSFTLRDSNQPVGNAQLNLSATNGAILSSSPIITNVNGTAEVSLTNARPGNASVTATLAIAPTISRTVATNFIAIPPNYELYPELILNNQPADSHSPNVARVKLYDLNTNFGVPDMVINYNELGSPFPPFQQITSSSGEITIYATSANPMEITYLVSLQVNPDIKTSFIFNFT